VDPDPDADALEAFARDLGGLRRAAGLSYRALARRAGYSVSALTAAAGGRVLPSLSVTLAYAGACGADPARWERRWRDIATEAAAGRPRRPASAGSSAGGDSAAPPARSSAGPPAAGEARPPVPPRAPPASAIR
jgi:transcriptional regulator with XRE-family HTH domain